MPHPLHHTRLQHFPPNTAFGLERRLTWPIGFLGMTGLWQRWKFHPAISPPWSAPPGTVQFHQ